MGGVCCIVRRGLFQPGCSCPACLKSAANSLLDTLASLHGGSIPSPYSGMLSDPGQHQCSCLVQVTRIGVIPLSRQVAGAYCPVVLACRLLYVLAFLQFTMSAFYEPAKRALTPLLVAPEDLHLATTLDSFAWSLMGAVGASLGGWFASRFGTAACFGLDACSYLVAALCAVQLKVSMRTGADTGQ